MENTKYKKHYPHDNKNKREMNPLMKKIRDLMNTHGMSESIAMQISVGILPLEIWLAKQREQQKKIQEEQKLEKKIAGFSDQTDFSFETAIRILKGCFLLKEYREEKLSKMERNKEAEELAKKEKIPLHVARVIAAGRFSVKDYLRRQKHQQERRNKANALHEKHPDIPLETCYTIIDQGLKIEEYLQKKEKNIEKRKEWYQNYLDEHQEDNKPLVLYLQKLKNKKINTFLSLFGYEAESGIIIGHTPYDIKIKNRQGRTVTLPKLKLKFLCRFSYADKVLGKIQIDGAIQSKPVLPAPNPYERYQIPEELLKEGKMVKLTLGEGEIFVGTILWVSRYDLKISISTTPKLNAIIFRHAIVHAEELDS